MDFEITVYIENENHQRAEHFSDAIQQYLSFHAIDGAVFTRPVSTSRWERTRWALKSLWIDLLQIWSGGDG